MANPPGYAVGRW